MILLMMMMRRRRRRKGGGGKRGKGDLSMLPPQSEMLAPPLLENDS